MTIRIALADDHRMFREALRSTLAAEADIEVVAEAGNAAEAFECLARSRPDILVLDIALPDLNGIEVAKQAMARFPKLKIVALSGYADRLFVENMLEAGARAYVVKSAGSDELLMAIRAVANGRLFLSPEVTASMLGRHAEPAGPPPLSALAPREKVVLKLLAQGKRSADIGRDLGISSATVDTYRRNIKRKLNLSSIAELTRYAIREGLLPS